MVTMKTFKDLTHLNYQQIAFFKNIPIVDAKWEVVKALKIKSKDLKVSKKRVPRIKMTDIVPSNAIDFKIKSNSSLEGENRLEYLTNYYNKGVDMQTLKFLGEHTAFIKKIKFIGKHKILEDILNPDQLKKLQQIWLFANCYNKKKFSKEAVAFINNHDWAAKYLESKGVFEKKTISHEQ